MKIKTIHNRGSHLVIDGFGCDNSRLLDESFIESFLRDIVKRLGMKAISDPKVVSYIPEDTDECGITGFIIIAESHISLHTYPSKDYLAIDIFSCREFDIDMAVKFVEKSFSPKKIEKSIVKRGHSEGFDEKRCDNVRGIDIKKSKSVRGLVGQFRNCGFQATNLSKAVDIIDKMRKEKATVFLTFTSNMVSSGLREVFAYLCEKKLVDLIITGVGSIEEDLIKSKKPFLIGDFHMDDRELHRKGINRIGNILVPNDRYEMLEDILIPFFEMIYKKKKIHSPSEMIYELGKITDDKHSILYWARKNKIPIFCPAITDGAFGLQVFFFKQKHDLIIDTTGDMKRLADITMLSNKTGGILLGGGFAKHHAIGVNILREGMDYSVYISTATQYDGSLSGARNTEAVSWSKIKEISSSVFVEGDATILFPLIVSSLKGI